MLKFSIFFPYSEGSRFDMTYYREKHLPMAQKTIGAICKDVSADEGLQELMPGTKPPYAAVGHLDLDVGTPEEFLAVFGPLAEALGADLPNFTDINPGFMISRIW